MNRIFSGLIISCLFIFISCSSSRPSASGSSESLTQYVNPFIGSAPLLDPKVIGYTPPPNWRVWAGLTYPGATLPNAMVQLSPITEYGSGAGYEYEDSLILGFTHTNKGHWNLCNIPVMPVTGEANANGKYVSRFSHDKESAGPGYYNVYLEDFQVDVNLTVSLRAGFHRYNYASANGKKILFDLSRANNKVMNWQIRKVADNAVEGFQQVHENKIYFYAQLNTNIENLEVSGNGKDQGQALINLVNNESKSVEMKIALSFVSEKNAKENLDAELGKKSFETVKAEANNTWEELLSKIRVEGGTEKQRRMFYSSLYRAFQWPSLKSDVNGEFFDARGQVVKAGHRYYDIPALWDTYRNKLVLLSIVSPQVTADVISSLNDRGVKTGFMPTFFHGDHAAPFISGAHARGLKGFDVKQSYELLLKNATVEGRSRPHLNEYIEKGFISDPDVANPHVETKAKAGVSKTLEYAYDDYSLARLAERLGDSENAAMLMKRSQNYRNMFDPSVNFMRGKLADGSWIKNFDPQYPYYEYMYREANAWQVSFFAPHDMKGLVSLYGGEAAFEAKLDSLFTVPWNPKHIARNVSSFIGQYCHGNQPDHEAPFSYYFINKPEKSQKIIDTILNNLYGIGEFELALCGMDDAGEMSSWYVCSALGLYPYSSSDPEYLVTVPLFDRVTWKMENGKELVIKKTGNSRKLKAISADGKKLDGYFLPHNQFQNGVELNIETE